VRGRPFRWHHRDVAEVNTVHTGSAVPARPSTPIALVVTLLVTLLIPSIVVGLASGSVAAAPRVDVSERILDTRANGSTVDTRYQGIGATQPGDRIFLDVAGRAGIPAGTTAAALNITVVRGRSAGYVSVDDCSSPIPSTSTINFRAGQTIANLAVTRLTDEGLVCIYSSGVSDLVVDVNATFGAADFVAVDPTRLLDTRSDDSAPDGSFIPAGPIQGGKSERVHVVGRPGIPGNVRQIVVNITAASPTGRGYFTVHPCGQSVPNTSNLNFAANRNVARLSVVEVGADGSFCLASSRRSHAIVDIFGYFSGSAFIAVDPARLVETRSTGTTDDGIQQGVGRLIAGETLEVAIAGRAGVPSNAGSVMLQITATDQSAAGFVTVHPSGRSRPTVSNLNHEPGVAVGNTAIVQLGANGNVCLFSERSVHMIVDVVGYFAGPPSTGVDKPCENTVSEGGEYALPGRGPVSADRILIENDDRSVPAADGTGNFRLVCGYSHMSYNDPIVAPGEPGRSHLHTFFGNTGADADSTYDSLRTTGNSTCDGGTANRSAYWIPSLLEGAAPVVPKLMFVYYKSGYRGVAPFEINNVPDGLRMIAGSSRSRNGQSSEIVSWSCESGGSSEFVQTIPNCQPGGELRLTITFPQCWNGQDLDSIDHQSHLAYPGAGPQFGQGCPSSHPVAIPVISTHVIWDVPASGTSGLFLSSDAQVGAAPGASAHADFYEAWDPTIRDAMTENCIRGALDCGVRGLGDGRSLAILANVRGLPSAKPVDGKAETGLFPVHRKLGSGDDAYVCSLL